MSDVEPCPFAIGDRVFVDADKLPTSFREDWRGVEAYVVAIRYDANTLGGLDITISEVWPPAKGNDWVDGFEVEQLAALSKPSPTRIEALEDAAAVVEKFHFPGGRISDWLQTNESPANAMRRLIAENIRALKSLPPSPSVNEEGI